MMMRAALFLFSLVPSLALGGDALPKAPRATREALREGASLFVDACLSCHGLSFVRYGELEGLGFSEKEIRENLSIAGDDPAQRMRIAARPEDQRLWFGAPPPDLSSIARAKASERGDGGDWLYAYLRAFRRDPARPTGWNNDVAPNTAMPHVLWKMQGALHPEVDALEESSSETLAPEEYDRRVAGLAGFLVWASEPRAAHRFRVGVGVCAFLAFFSALALALKREYWRDIENEKD
jgi:ubiquinol-cytochrome c reductase cytochrome c1 subunit